MAAEFIRLRNSNRICLSEIATNSEYEGLNMPTLEKLNARGWRLLVCGFLIMSGTLSWVALTAQADEDKSKKKTPLEVTMREKLQAAAKVLEGLATEDKALIHDGSVVLTELSKAETWQVFKDSEYREHTQSFRSAVRRMDEFAAGGQFASAQLEWLDATKCCFDCHNHIRSEKSKAAK